MLGLDLLLFICFNPSLTSCNLLNCWFEHDFKVLTYNVSPLCWLMVRIESKTYCIIIMDTPRGNQDTNIVNAYRYINFLLPLFGKGTRAILRELSNSIKA